MPCTNEKKKPASEKKKRARKEKHEKTLHQRDEEFQWYIDGMAQTMTYSRISQPSNLQSPL